MSMTLISIARAQKDINSKCSAPLGPWDRRLCMRLVLVHVCDDRPFSVTSEESLRDSEPPDIFLLGTRAPRDRRSECIKLVLLNVALVLSILH